MGICTQCGYVSKDKEQHQCNENYILLGTTDWKVKRQTEQISRGETPSMNDVEFNALLAERQAARDAI